MPFQSEKQRRYLHANHPEIAKRWERDYANGGISNHFRKRFFKGAQADTAQGQAMSPGTSASGGSRHTPSGNGGGGGGPKPHSGPTAAELAAQKKAAAERAKRKVEAESMAIIKAHKEWKNKQKEKRSWVTKKLFPQPLEEFTTPVYTEAFEVPKAYTYGRTPLPPQLQKPYDYGKGQGNISNIRHAVGTSLAKDAISDYLTQSVPTDKWYSGAIKKGADITGGIGAWTHGLGQEIGDAYRSIKQGHGIKQSVEDVIANSIGLTLDKGDAWSKGDEVAEYYATSESPVNEYLQSLSEGQTGALSQLDLRNQLLVKGGVARKNYFHGGILDITGDEEITTDDGNDIELTAYNAAFDDPNDLSTGVKTLFQAKNGGSYVMQGGVKNYLGDQETVSDIPIKWRSGPDSPPTELAYITKAEKDLLLKKDLHGSLKDGPNTGPEGLMSLDSQGDRGTYGQTGQSYGDRQTTDTSPEVGDAPSKQDLQEYKENRAIREANQKAADDAKEARAKQSWEEQWGKWNDKYDKLNKYSYTGSGVTKRAKLTDKNYNEDRAALEKKFGKTLIQKIFGALVLGMPISIGYSEIKAVKSMYDLEKKYKADMQNLKDISIDKGWADFHHAVDTPMQTIDQLMMDTIKVRDDDDTKGDEGPPQVVPVHEEIEEYEGTYAMSPWDRIKANQAKRALLVEKGIIQENPIVDESVTDITMQANRGGLANLFRVKNQ